MELHSTAPRHPPQGWPPTDEEAIDMFRAFTATAGRANWEQKGDHLRVGQLAVTMAHDPRFEGTTMRCALDIDGDKAVCETATPNANGSAETWRRLGGTGSSPLSGAWENAGEDDIWIYLVTAGHYGVMRTSRGRPTMPRDGDSFSDDGCSSCGKALAPTQVRVSRRNPPLTIGRCLPKWPDMRWGSMRHSESTASQTTASTRSCLLLRNHRPGVESTERRSGPS
jgi:hypothetical protein